MIYTAFIVGLLGSFHCIGMCGPIAFALPVQSKSTWNLVKSRVIYNLGRIVTYGFLGGLVGLLGRGLVLSSSQQWLSIIIGSFILFFVILPHKISRRFEFLQPFQKTTFYVKQKFGRLFRQKTSKSYVLVGLLNGFLPCGLVYLAMAGAIATGDILQGILYMAVFGLGTLPMMLTVALAGNFVKPKFKVRMYRLVPVFTVFLAILFILRGLNLGIPYVSPKITKTDTGIKAECCEVAEE